MRHDCSKGDLGYMGLLSDLNLNINNFPGNLMSNPLPPPLAQLDSQAVALNLPPPIHKMACSININSIEKYCVVQRDNGLDVGFPGKSYMFLFKSKSNPI